MTQNDSISVPRLLNMRKTAELLGVSQRTVWSLSASGALPSVRIGNRRLFDPADIRDFIARQKQEGRR